MIQSVIVSAVAVAGLWVAGPLLPPSPLAEVAPAVSAPAPAPVGACAPQSAAQAPVQAVIAPAPSQAGLDVNTATAEQFDALPLRAITPEVAAAIVAKRDELPGRRFTSLAQIDDVKGVGPATERQLPQHVHV